MSGNLREVRRPINRASRTDRRCLVVSQAICNLHTRLRREYCQCHWPIPLADSVWYLARSALLRKITSAVLLISDTLVFTPRRHGFWPRLGWALGSVCTVLGGLLLPSLDRGAGVWRPRRRHELSALSRQAPLQRSHVFRHSHSASATLVVWCGKVRTLASWRTFDGQPLVVASVARLR